ncbi:aromatic motif membrane protein [Mycoplasmopsis verecunda]|uniref:Aromatic cluster surface protein n=1 Tax=Mycoplasmopsis verecunda TaxID=171291 RepID=A0A1T4KFA9_9BACT|nr:aromatic motif membrane protein [Mycoplasmopsis verecunda]WPB54882.1 hypothetical protein SAM46_01860 [Mycoplasmopsis verecunda]SJZ41047.1 aromatic cluster surface protein [Mycoplasmopsis verecunda]
MKLSKILSLSSLIALSPLISISCGTNTHTEIKMQEKANNVDLQWNNFINQNAIADLLSEIYGNNIEAKNQYIASQKELVDTDYNKQLSVALKYANLITRQSSAYDDFSNPYSFFAAKSYPYPVKESDQVINSAFKNNWLWSLFNINKFTYMQNDTFTRANNESEDSFALRDNENKLLYSIFSNIKSNQFIQYVKQVENNSNDIRFYLLNKDGYIIQIDIYRDIDEETKEVKANQVNIFPYIKTFPRLLQARYKNEMFNLNKYVSLFASFNIDNSNKTQTDEVLYKDFYGGVLLQYSPVDIK